MSTPTKEFYHEELNRVRSKISFLSKVNQRYVVARLSIAILAILIAAFLWNAGIYWGLGICVALGLAIFLLLLQRHQKIGTELKLNKQLSQIIEREKASLNGKVSWFKTGENFLTADHHFARDLDLLGKKGLYQHICRTTTTFGDQMLANLLLYPLDNRESILSRQAIFKELSEKVKWRLNFRAKAQLAFSKVKELKGIESISPFFSEKMAFKVLRIISPIVFVSLILFVLFGVLPQGSIVIFLLAQLGITAKYLKRINRVHGLVGKRQHTLRLYSIIFREFEMGNFENEQLRKLQNESKGASSAIDSLNKEINLLDSRLNMIMGVVLNSVMLWDIRRLIRIENWFKEHQEKFEMWLMNIAHFEAYESMANFCFNNELFIFPELPSDSDFIIEAKELGHPLMSQDICVSNDFSLKQGGQIVLLSGANMSGKSTFLRTLGLNMALAKMGLPVCAKEFAMKSVSIFTSMRIDDDLNDGESFFYAELKRLQQLIIRLEKGEDVFFLLDEILRGTNSNDKHKGSEGLLKKLIELKSSGILATHDIALSTLEEKYPNKLLNKSFEVENEDGELVFDYKLKSGVCKNLNASYLMKKMGVIDG